MGTFNRRILCRNRSWDVYWPYIRGEGEAGGLQLVGGFFANEIWGGGAYIREGLFSGGGGRGGGRFLSEFYGLCFWRKPIQACLFKMSMAFRN